MPGDRFGFQRRLASLRVELAEQGARVRGLIESAAEAVFALDQHAAQGCERLDDAIDRADVHIEQACVELLTEATRDGAALDARQLRGVLTIVKVNNELERAADAAVAIALEAAPLARAGQRVPETFRVLTNSVVGIMRDVVRSFEGEDPALARVVLDSEDAVEQFRVQLVRDAERRIASGALTAEQAFALIELAGLCARIADHATNIAEQVIYLVTGTIVRHTDAGWVDVTGPT